MRFLLATILTALLGFIAGIFLPWWSIAIVAFAAGLLLPQRHLLSFLSGFAGIFLLWAGIAAWIDLANDSILSHRIAQIIPLGGSSILLLLVSAFIGALVGGFAAMAGSALRPGPRPRKLRMER